MAQHRVVVLVCDFCSSEDLVEKHRIVVDGTARDAEACDTCWSQTLALFARWATQGRAPAEKKSKLDELVQWPDTPWRFTAHAIQRMGERRVKPADVLKVIAEPEIKRPGHAADEEIWERAGTKVVVVPNRMAIKTVASTTYSLSYPKAV